MSSEIEPALEEGLIANDHMNGESEQKDLRLPITALCIGVLTQGYLLISCFPYIAFMCIFLVPEVNEQSAGSYAGIISAMFMIGRAISSYAWGKVANKYGRKQVFYWSYILSIIFSISFGMSTNIGMAITFRFFLGASNGLVSVVKTVCSEIAEGDKVLEGRVMGFVFGMRGWGFLISPAIGGYLSDPMKQFPNSFLSKTFPDMLTKYPYILPNLMGVVLCSVGLITTYFFIKETKPEQIPETETSVSMRSVWSKPATRDHLISFWLLVFCSLSYDESVPLYFVSTEGGLSLQEKSIGAILSGAGLFYGILQFLLYYQIMTKFGLFGTMKLACILGTPLAILTPLSSIMNSGEPANDLNLFTYIFLVALLGTVRIFAGVFFATSSLAANRSVTAEEQAAMNRLSMMGGSIAQSLGPLCAGYLTSFALSSGDFPPSVAVYVTFSAVCVCGSALAVFTWIQLEKHHRD